LVAYPLTDSLRNEAGCGGGRPQAAEAGGPIVICCGVQVERRGSIGGWFGGRCEACTYSSGEGAPREGILGQGSRFHLWGGVQAGRFPRLDPQAHDREVDPDEHDSGWEAACFPLSWGGVIGVAPRFR